VSAGVFFLVLFAAFLHAVWNAIVKNARDKTLTAVLMAAFAGALAAAVLPFLDPPAPASWPYLAISSTLQVGYYLLVAGAYRSADMSQAYPLMRGTAPLIVAVVTAFWLGEHLPPAAWIGIATVSAGVVGVSFAGSSAGNGKGLALALGNAFVIAAYTITDGLGVRQSGSAAGYTAWLFVLTAIPLVAWEVRASPAAFHRYVVANLPIAAIGGAGSLVSYGLALWAMTLAPVAVVAALRETSILFAVVIAALVLRERVTPARAVAAAVIVAGAAVLRLA
jgi:drug/metabolite transporter (DMT)-like permease